MNKATHFILLFGVVIAAPALAQDSACTTCHAGYTSGEVHAAAQTSCEACHGPGDEHVTNPTAGILRFGEGPIGDRVAACNGCHSAVHAADRSKHAQAGFACDDCHSVHDNEAQTGHALPAGFDRDRIRANIWNDATGLRGQRDTVSELAVLGRFLQSRRMDSHIDGDTRSAASEADPVARAIIARPEGDHADRGE